MTAAALLVAFALYLPPPGDALRLPPFAELRAGRDFNRRHQSHLEERLCWEPQNRAWLREVLDETRWLYEVWDCAEGAHPDYGCSPECKARYLRRLRILIGPDAYRRAELPPCVWRFNDLKE